jgi:hypothetical protein
MAAEDICGVDTAMVGVDTAVDCNEIRGGEA